MPLYPQKQGDLLTVTQLTAELKRFVSGRFRDVHVEGEVSNAKLYPSGHFYFTLKDDAAIIRSVFFNYSSRFHGTRTIKSGDKVLCRGMIDIYEKRGEYQLITSDLVSKGDHGLAYLQFLELKERLYARGLFDEAFKKNLPILPRCIGIVTSPAGAAIRDMLCIIHERFGNIPVLLYPAAVQGRDAAHDIIEGIRHFNETQDVDVIIIGRGGGSYEDLSPFNDELLARVIFESGIPIVSAVGHEIDYTIADFVADVRAATPTSAAALVCPDKDDILNYLSGMKDRLYQVIRRKLEKTKYDFVREVMEFKDRKDFFASHNIYLDDLSASLEHNLYVYMNQTKGRFESLSQRLADLNPTACLARGYSITSKKDTGTVVTDASQVSSGDTLSIVLDNGTIYAAAK